jgi:hypothetical protein
MPLYLGLPNIYLLNNQLFQFTFLLSIPDNFMKSAGWRSTSISTITFHDRERPRSDRSECDRHWPETGDATGSASRPESDRKVGNEPVSFNSIEHDQRPTILCIGNDCFVFLLGFSLLELSFSRCKFILRSFFDNQSINRCAFQYLLTRAERYGEENERWDAMMIAL